jgi:hypothetical protein
MTPTASLLIAALVLAGCVGLAPAPSPATAPETGARWNLHCDAPLADGWQQPCLDRVSTGPRTKAETWIAVNPTDARNVVMGVKDLDPAKSNACVWVSYYATHDAGATWTDVTPAGLYADRAPPDPAFGWACNTDPMLAFGPDGQLHAIVEFYGVGKSVSALLSAGTRILLFNSADGGATWDEGTMLIAGDGLATSPDYPRIAVSPASGSVVSSFIDYVAGQRCYVVVSRDGGQTVDAPVLLRTPGTPGCQSLAIGPDGTIVVGWRGDGSLGGVGGVAGFAASRDDGATFANTGSFSYTPVAGAPRGTEAGAFTNLELAFDAQNRLYAIYGDNTAGNADVVLRWSDDHGATWSDAVRVDDDATQHQQWLPGLAVAGDGSLQAFFLDRRYDPDDRLVGVTHAWSLDRGATWRNERVSNATWDADLGRHQDGYAWIGDYTGVAAAGDHVWAAVPDASLGGEPVLAAAHVARH